MQYRQKLNEVIFSSDCSVDNATANSMQKDIVLDMTAGAKMGLAHTHAVLSHPAPSPSTALQGPAPRKLPTWVASGPSKADVELVVLSESNTATKGATTVILEGLKLEEMQSVQISFQYKLC
jgi:hypothetical protein